MVVCQYWQKGTCTHGNACRFEHVGRSPGNIFGGGGAPTSQGQGGDITSTLMATVKQDVEQSQNGRQWLFSCYSPVKDCACVPGLDDVSPEEMRYEAMSAKSAGTASQYQQKYSQMIESYTDKRRALLNPTQDMKVVLKKIYNKENISNISSIFDGGASMAGSCNVFGSQSSGGGIFGGSVSSTTSSLFGGSQSNSAALFGGQSGSSSSTSLFGGGGAGSQSASTSVFGGKAVLGGGGGSLFGGSNLQQQQQQASTFGGTGNLGSSTTSSGIFGGSSGSSSMLGGKGIFGGGGQQSSTTPAQSSGIFGSPSTFSQVGSGGSTSVFGTSAPTTTASSNVFGGGRETATFGSVQQQQGSSNPIFSSVASDRPSESIFGGSSSSGPFGNPASTTSASGQLPSEQSAVTSTGSSIFGGGGMASVFGAPTNAPPGTASSTGVTPGSNPFQRTTDSAGGGMFGKKVAEQMDSSLYSLLEGLSVEELNAFKATDFELGKIPEKPPPREFCQAA